MTGMDDDMLMAYLDGELGPIEAKRVEQALAENPELRRRIEVQQRLRARLAAHYDPAAREPVPERFRAMLESDVIALDARRARQPVWQNLAALAATLLLGLFVGRALPTGAPIAIEDRAIIARDDLATALDRQLASAQPADAATRIGISFASNDGRLCRTFEQAAMAGLACRGEAGWQVMVASARRATSGGDYRQAGSDSARVLEAAQEMISGAPFDAAAEARARDSGWRPVR